MVETMIWRQEQQLLEVLDQTKLPQECEFIACKDYQRVKLAIKRLEVRGAPAIGAAAAAGIVPANIIAQAAIIIVVFLIFIISIRYNEVQCKLWSP